MSRTTNTVESVKDLFVKEQFLTSCSKDLAAHLREKELANLDDMATRAVRFLIAHNRRFHGTEYDSNERQSFPVEGTSPNAPKNELPSGSNVIKFRRQEIFDCSKLCEGRRRIQPAQDLRGRVFE